jgi:hypothetical protein
VVGVTLGSSVGSGVSVVADGEGSSVGSSVVADGEGSSVGSSVGVTGVSSCACATPGKARLVAAASMVSVMASVSKTLSERFIGRFSGVRDIEGHPFKTAA